MRFGMLLCCVCALQAADIHVATTGNDSTGDGSQGSPYATVAQGLSLADSGDRVLLRRGDVFRESDLPVGTNRTLGAYGTGDRPVIAGSTVVTGFTAHGGGVYKATVDIGTRDTELCFVDGQRLTIARYPDTGWLRANSGTTGDAIVSNELNGLEAAGHWTDGVVRWRRWSWWYETRPITADDGSGNLTLAARDFSAPDNVGIDSGFYIDHLLSECDAPGEWYYDAAADMLYIYPPAGADPATMLVELCNANRGISLGSGTVENISLRHYDNEAVSVGSPGTIDGCLIEHCGNKGIGGSWNAYGATVVNCTIRDILNVGIGWNEDNGSAGGTVIEHNALERIGMVPAYGGSGSWHASGLTITNGSTTNGVQVRYNRFTDIGYAGVICGKDNQVVHRNIFLRCMSTLNDGAAIYTNSNGNQITENIVLETVGDFDSSQPWYPLGHGIWPEFLSDFKDHVITGNTVYGCGGNGLFLTNNYTATVNDNVFLSNRLAGLHVSGGGGSPANQDNSITNNVSGVGAIPYNTSKAENEATWNYLHDFDRCLRFSNASGIDNDFGTMTGNSFVRPEAGVAWVTEGDTELTIAEWQADESAWADSGVDTVTADTYLFINDTTATASFPLPAGITWQHLDGSSAGSAVSIAPYRSVVLVAASGDVSSLAGYRLFSTVNHRRRLTATASGGAGGWLLTPDEGSVSDSGDSITASDLEPGTAYTLEPITPSGG